MGEPIVATGYWTVPLFEREQQWNINYSDILTKLIQYAGKYCEHYASDLFIIWKYNIEDKLKDRNLESFTLRLGFRESGVDDEVSTNPERTPITNNLKECGRYYYRQLVTLMVEIDKDRIAMAMKTVY